jgi:hypothetical protein
MLMFEYSRAPELVYKVLESERASEKGGTEGVDSSIEEQNLLPSELRYIRGNAGSSGRIRDQRMRPALEGPETN